MKLETRIYGWLLKAYPKAFRLEFETEMLQVFRLEIKNVQLEKRALLFWIATVFDCLRGVAREWFFGKGERMNWFVKFCGLSSLIFASSLFADAGFRMFHRPGHITADFSSTIFNISGGLILFTAIGIFLTLPKRKTRLEWFGIGATCVSVIIQNLFAMFGNHDLEANNRFGFLFLIGYLAICFARVRFHNTSLDWSEMPKISRSLLVVMLFFVLAINASSIFAPVFEALHYLGGLTNKNVIYNRGDIISSILMGLAFVALAFGIWRSKPSQTSTPNLISS